MYEYLGNSTHIIQWHFFLRDIRSVALDVDRIVTFDSRAEKYYPKFINNASNTAVAKLPYLYYVRNHVGDLMVLHSNMFKLGYGAFCCHAGEHLNKLIKTSELNDTNLDINRFHTITHLMRVKQLIFTHMIIPKKSTVKCSACGQIGHNKKNKSFYKKQQTFFSKLFSYKI